MKNIELVIPKLNQYSYEQKLESDSKTMSYNAGYDVSYFGYHYNTGCIDFPKEKWRDTYNKRINENKYFAYIKDCTINRYVGYVNYQYNKNDDIYECGVLIESKYRGKGYSKDALRLLIKEANKNGIEYLYDTFEKDRENTLKAFLDVGFEVYKETTWKKFDNIVDGIIVRIKTDKIIPDTSNLKTIDDILDFMKNNIRYGWLDINNEIHIGNMKNFRKLYRTLSIDEILKYGIGTCVDQVKLMNYLLNKINIKNKMFATRIYEPNDFNKLDEEEHMHCFILCFIDNKVYHIEHPNWYRIGIYEYEDEQEALKTINDYYIKLSGGISRPITEFYKIDYNISFKEFNCYINNLDVLKNNNLNSINRWTFGIDTDKLVKLVLDGKKTATTSLYEYDSLPTIGELSILTDSNNNDICILKTKKVIITEFTNITWDLAKLEGENNSLKEWRKVHKDYFNKIDSTFNDDTKIIFEIFEVVERCK